MGNALTFDEKNFQTEVVQSAQPVLVDFWAVWCGPCQAVAPMVETVAEEFAGRAKVGKLDVDHNQSIAAQYGIRAIPTLLLFKGGEVVDRIVGLPPSAQALSEKLTAAL